MNAHAICLGLSQRQQHEWGSTLDIPVGLTRIDGMERAVASPNMCVCAIIGEADSSPLDTARAVHHHWPMASILIATTSDKLVDIRGQLSTAVGVPSDIQIIADEDLRQLRFATSELIQQGGKRFEYRPVLKDANTKLDSAPKYVPILPMATEELLERLPVGVMLLGADGKAEYVNKVGQSMAGASILEETSVSWGEWLPKAQSSQLQKLIQGLGLGGRASHGVIEVSPILGPPLCLEVEASACSDENSSSKTLLVMQDVTARNAAEEAKTRFLANVSHEFRTPLNAIIGYGEILESECGLSQDQRGKIATLNGAAQHLLLLINNVLEFASIEAGAVQLKSEPFDLKPMLKTISEIFALSCIEKGLTWTPKIRIDDETMVRGDAAKLSQVLVNLAGNAVKFTASGNVTFSVSQEGSLYSFSVHDTGAGISETDLQKITMPFYQAESASFAAGTGLGLSISQNLIELMGSDLMINSQLGCGSIFRFAVMLEPATKLDAPINQPLRRDLFWKIANDREIDILVVDDNQANRDLLLFSLTRAGACVRTAIDGADALRQVQSKKPDLIFTDLRMPVMTGRELLAQLRGSSIWKDIPCVAVTVSGRDEMTSSNLASDFDAHIQKPIRLERVFTTIKRLLNVDFCNSDQRENDNSNDAVRPLSKKQHPSPQLIQRVLNAAQIGDVAVIESILNQEGEQFGRFLQPLKNFTQQYDFTAIKELINDAGWE